MTVELGWVQIATIVGGFATAVGATFAIVGGMIAYLQIKEQRKLQGEAMAKMLYRQYLEDAMKWPQFFDPDYDNIVKLGQEIQYNIFMAQTLFACEEILKNTRDNEWDSVIETQLQRHSAYFSTESFKNKIPMYEFQIQNLIREIVKKNTDKETLPSEIEKRMS